MVGSGGGAMELEGRWEVGGGGNHVKFPCYIRHLYGKSIEMCLISKQNFGLHLFVPVESFLKHISGIRP